MSIRPKARSDVAVQLYNDHGLNFFLALPMALHYPSHGAWPGTTVPVCIKTAQVSLPSKARC